MTVAFNMTVAIFYLLKNTCRILINFSEISHFYFDISSLISLIRRNIYKKLKNLVQKSHPKFIWFVIEDSVFDKTLNYLFFWVSWKFLFDGLSAILCSYMIYVLEVNYVLCLDFICLSRYEEHNCWCNSSL